MATPVNSCPEPMAPALKRRFRRMRRILRNERKASTVFNNQQMGETRTLRPRSIIAQVASVLSKVDQAYRDPLIYPEGGGEPVVRHDQMGLAVLQAQFEECGDCGWENLHPTSDLTYGILFGKMTALQTILRNPDDLEAVLRLENDLHWQAWFHLQRQYGFSPISETAARQAVLEKTGREDIDLEPCSSHRRGVINGSLWAVRWALGQEWDQVAS